MKKIFVTTTAVKTKYAPYALSNYNRVLNAAKRDKHKNFELWSDPETADFILFIESEFQYHFDIFSSQLFRQYSNKSFIFDFSDNTIPRIPGIYLSIPKTLHSCQLYQYGYYLRVFDNMLTKSVSVEDERKYLYSFVGRADNCPQVRRPILNLPTDRACLTDRSTAQTDNDESYMIVMGASQFVLCPRGIGPSTWRVYEAMSAGRVPVIISDEWYPPLGPNWREFSLRFREDEILSIPQKLEALQHRSKFMGEKARNEWQKYFAIESAFNWIGNTLTQIQAAKETTNSRDHGSVWPLALHKLHTKHLLKEYARFSIRNLRQTN